MHLFEKTFYRKRFLNGRFFAILVENNEKVEENVL